MSVLRWVGLFVVVFNVALAVQGVRRARRRDVDGLGALGRAVDHAQDEGRR